MCDLGCGDGVLAGQVLAENRAADVTLVDGSAEMLAAARKRLAFAQRVSFVQKSFQELLQNSAELARFDLLISSFAIHHLARTERHALFGMIHGHLASGGFLLNIDVGLPAHAIYTEWQYGLWQEWLAARDKRLGLRGEFLGVPRKARENPDNQYSPLADQIEDLQAAGFTEVECHYKYGVFTIYSGRHA